MSIVDELITLLGFELKPDTQQKVQKFDKAIESIHKTALIAAASISAAAASIAYFTTKAVSSASELDKYNELTGTGAAEIQKWGYAAEQAGGSAKSVRSDIEGLLEAMNPVMPGEFNQGLFLLGMYGQRYKDTTELMMALSEKLKDMAPMEAMNWAKRAGISNDTLLLLRKGKDGIKSLMSQTPYLMSEEQTAAARKFEAQINKIKYSLVAMSEMIVTKTLPVIIKLVDRFERWTEKNKELISSRLIDFITGITEGISRFVTWMDSFKTSISKTTPFLEKMLNILTDPKVIGGTVAGSLVGITVVVGLLAAKWVLIGSAIALAVLALQDFIDTSNGMKETVSNKLLNWVNDKPEWMLDEKGKKEQRERIAAREQASANTPARDKSALLKTFDAVMGMVDNMGKAPAPSVPVTNAPTTNHITVNNDVQVNGATTPYETANELGYKLGTIQWGDVAAPTR